jgi:hypothetical protein
LCDSVSRSERIIKILGGSDSGGFAQFWICRAEIPIRSLFGSFACQSREELCIIMSGKEKDRALGFLLNASSRLYSQPIQFRSMQNSHGKFMSKEKNNMPDYAQLSQEEIAQIQSLEEKLDAVLVAYTQYAELSPEALESLQKLESKLGKVIVAYSK